MSAHLLLAWLQDTRILGTSISGWALAIGATPGSYLALRLALRVGLGKLTAIARHTTNRFDDLLADVLGRTSRLLVALIALLIGVGFLELPPRWMARVDHLWFLALALQIVLWLNRAVNVGVSRYLARADEPGIGRDTASGTVVSWTLRIVLWSVIELVAYLEQPNRAPRALHTHFSGHNAYAKQARQAPRISMPIAPLSCRKWCANSLRVSPMSASTGRTSKASAKARSISKWSILC